MSAGTQLMVGLQALSGVLGFVNQYQQAEAQADAIEADYRQQMETARLQQQQNNAAAAQQMSERARQAMIERGRLRAISAERGLAGISTDRLLSQSRFNEGYDLATIEANRFNTSQQYALEARGARAQAQSRINSINRPRLIGTGLQIAGAFASGMAETERHKRIDSSTRRY